ncbi:MAG: hypothetical protein WBK55_08925 [Alphaproteobacteria bacterium]
MKKRIVIFCNKYLGFTLLSSGGVLADLIDAFDVTIITTPSAEESIRMVTGGRCAVVTHDIETGKIRETIYGAVGDILGMTYARSGARRNRTGILHRKAHLKLVKNKTMGERLHKKIIVMLSELAENSGITRKILQAVFYAAAPKSDLAAMIRKINPALCIATTAGLDEDGVFFAASRNLGVPCVALIQSWDRTASKGYPTVRPDHCIVWNAAMAEEAEIFLGIPSERVYVAGAPPWDNYLSASGPLEPREKTEFFRRWNLDESKKLVFVALNAQATHAENLRMIRDICAAVKNGEFPGVQFMLRSHPGYLIEREKTKEIETVFDKCRNADVNMMHPIVIDPAIRNHIVTDEDRKFMHDMFRACDVTVSMMSTWMIESAIFDKPNVCVEYGRYITGLYDFDLSEYQAEHIARIFSYDAVYRARSAPALMAMTRQALENPDELATQRKRLAEAETGPNKGRARQAFLAKILEITA